METMRLGSVEGKCADIIWENAPLTTRELVNLCSEKLNWKRTTTYTVLRKFCERGLFKMENSVVSVLIPKDEFISMQSEQFVEEVFDGSLPSFLAAFTSRKSLTDTEIEVLHQLIESSKSERK